MKNTKLNLNAVCVYDVKRGKHIFKIMTRDSNSSLPLYDQVANFFGYENINEGLPSMSIVQFTPLVNEQPPEGSWADMGEFYWTMLLQYSERLSVEFNLDNSDIGFYLVDDKFTFNRVESNHIKELEKEPLMDDDNSLFEENKPVIEKVIRKSINKMDSDNLVDWRLRDSMKAKLRIHVRRSLMKADFDMNKVLKQSSIEFTELVEDMIAEKH